MAFVHASAPGGFDLMKRLADALGLAGRSVGKFILEVDFQGGLVTLYVKEFPESGQVEALAAAIEGAKVIPVDGAMVTDDCEVAYAPRGA